MATAGSIVVELVAKTGTFETDTQRAGKAMKKLQKDIDDAGKKIGVAFGAATVGIGYLVKSAIDGQDHLNDLAKKTGIAADTLGGIGFAAAQSGSDLDSAAAAAGKLNKSLAEAAAGNKEAKEAFDALGISVKDAAGNTKKADVALAEIANKFAGYEDGPEKAALALRLFGKAGADLIPLLDEGGRALLDNIDYFKRYSGVTEDSVKAADAFNDTLTKLHLLSGAFGNQLAAEVLPLLQTLADRFLQAKEQGNGFQSTAEGITTILKGLTIAGAYVIDTFGGVGREIGAIAAQLVALGSGDFKRFRAISDEVKADGVRAKQELDDFVAKVLNPVLAKTSVGDYSNEGRGKSKKPPAPRLPGDKDKDKKAKEDPFLKRQREAALDAAKAYEAFYQEQLQVLAGLQAETKAAEEQAAVFGLTKDELHAFNREKILAAAASLELKAITEGDREGGAAVAKLYREQAAALRETALARDFLNQKEHVLSYDAVAGATQAVKDYLDEIERAGDATRRVVDDAFRSLEDGLTSALMGGNIKNIAKSFVDQILSEIYRLYVVKPLLASIFGGGSSGGLGQVLGLVSSLTSGYTLDTTGAGDYSTVVPGRPRGGAATGANSLERDMITLVHKGEAIVPKAYNPAAGGAMAKPNVVVNQYGDRHAVETGWDGKTLEITMRRIAQDEQARGTRPGGMIRQGLRRQAPDRN